MGEAAQRAAKGHGQPANISFFASSFFGLGDSPRTILTELSRIKAADIMLPLADGSARELRIRCVVRPDRSQALLIDRSGLTLPERLRAYGWPLILTQSSKMVTLR